MAGDANVQSGDQPESVFDLVGDEGAPAQDDPAASAADGDAPEGAPEEGKDASPSDQPERPPWLPEKFKTPEDLAKSYRELEKKLSEYSEKLKNIEPPEEYQLAVPDGIEIGEPLLEAFKEAGLTNDQAQKMVEVFANTVLPEVQKVQAEAMIAQLSSVWGVDAATVKTRLENLKQWAEVVFDPTAVHMFGRSVEGIQLLEQLYNKFGYQTPAAPAKKGELSQEEIDALVADPRFDTDELYRQRVMQLVMGE